MKGIILMKFLRYNRKTVEKNTAKIYIYEKNDYLITL